MPKYYCRSGDFRLLCDAPDPVAAGARLVVRAVGAMGVAGGPRWQRRRRMGLAGGLGFLVAVSEKGYDDPQAGMLPTIPLAMEAGGRFVVAEFGLDLRAMPPGGRDWLFGGEDSDEI